MLFCQKSNKTLFLDIQPPIYPSIYMQPYKYGAIKIINAYFLHICSHILYFAHYLSSFLSLVVWLALLIAFHPELVTKGTNHVLVCRSFHSQDIQMCMCALIFGFDLWFMISPFFSISIWWCVNICTIFLGSYRFYSPDTIVLITKTQLLSRHWMKSLDV